MQVDSLWQSLYKLLAIAQDSYTLQTLFRLQSDTMRPRLTLWPLQMSGWREYHGYEWTYWWLLTASSNNNNNSNSSSSTGRRTSSVIFFFFTCKVIEVQQWCKKADKIGQIKNTWALKTKVNGATSVSSASVWVWVMVMPQCHGFVWVWADLQFLGQIYSFP